MTPRWRPGPARSAWRPVSALKTVVFPAPGKPVSPTFMPPRGRPRPAGGPRSSSRPRSRRAGPWRAPRRAAGGRSRRSLRRPRAGAPQGGAGAPGRGDALVTEPGRGEDGSEVRELARLDACLLGQLARRARAGRLVGRVEDARRQLPDVAAGGVAVLADEHDAPVVVDRGHGRRARVAYQLQVDRRAVRERDPLDAQVDDP